MLAASPCGRIGACCLEALGWRERSSSIRSSGPAPPPPRLCFWSPPPRGSGPRNNQAPIGRRFPGAVRLPATLRSRSSCSRGAGRGRRGGNAAAPHPGEPPGARPQPRAARTRSGPNCPGSESGELISRVPESPGPQSRRGAGGSAASPPCLLRGAPSAHRDHPRALHVQSFPPSASPKC